MNVHGVDQCRIEYLEGDVCTRGPLNIVDRVTRTLIVPREGRD